MSIWRVYYIIACFVFGIVFLYTRVQAQSINSTERSQFITIIPTLYERAAQLRIPQRGWFESENHFLDRIKAAIKKNEEQNKRYQEVYKKLYQSKAEARVKAEKIIKEAREVDEIKKKLQEQKEKEEAALDQRARMLYDAADVVSLYEDIVRDEGILERLLDSSDIAENMVRVNIRVLDEKYPCFQKKIIRERIKANRKIMESYSQKYCFNPKSQICENFKKFVIQEQCSRTAHRITEWKAREREAEEADSEQECKKAI